MAQGRRVRRIIRNVDVGSVLKVALLFWLTMWLVVLFAGVILWAAAERVGALDNVTKFMSNIGFEDFVLHGGAILRAGVLGGAVGVATASTLTVLGAVLFNLICDLVGGVELSVLEEVPVAGLAAERVDNPAPVGRQERHEAAGDRRVSSARSGL